MRGPKHVESRKQEEAQYFKEMKVTGFRNQQDLQNFPIHRCYSSLHWKWCLRTWPNAQNSEAKLWSTDLHWKTVILCQSNVSKQILSDHKTATLNWLELKPTVFGSANPVYYCAWTEYLLLFHDWLSKTNGMLASLLITCVSAIINLGLSNSVGVLLGSMFGYKLCPESAEGSRMLKWLNAKCQLSNEKRSGAVSGRPDQMLHFG